MLVFAQLPQPLPPPPPEIRTLGRERGDQVRIDGQGIRSPWAWIPPRDGQPPQLWLPLELLENRLGFSRTQGTLRWFGTEHPLAQLPQRRLGDEVALDAWPWLQQLGVTPDRDGPRLELTLQAPTLQQLRRGTGERSDRLVLDLDGPVFVQRVGRDLVLELRADQDQIRMLQGMGIGAAIRAAPCDCADRPHGCAASASPTHGGWSWTGFERVRDPLPKRHVRCSR